MDLQKKTVHLRILQTTEQDLRRQVFCFSREKKLFIVLWALKILVNFSDNERKKLIETRRFETI